MRITSEVNVRNNVKYVTQSKNRIQYFIIKYVFLLSTKFWSLLQSVVKSILIDKLNSKLSLAKGSIFSLTFKEVEKNEECVIMLHHML